MTRIAYQTRAETRPGPSHNHLSRRDFLKASTVWTLRAALLGLGGLDYVRSIEPDWVSVTRLRVALPGLPDAFSGYRIVQVSDIHMSEWMTLSRLDEIVSLANRQNADLICLTGDYVTHNGPAYASLLVAGLRNLSAADGVVAVMGNHDQGYNEEAVRSALRDAGIDELRNSTRPLQRGRSTLHMAGVDDIWQGKDRLDLVLDKLPSGACTILLAHEPDFADTSGATSRFAMQLSGHSHGGQVVVPFVGPTRLPPFGRKYVSGAYRVGEMIQYTNRGVGMVHPFVRFNCRPEVTVFTLMPGSEAGLMHA